MNNEFINQNIDMLACPPGKKIMQSDLTQCIMDGNRGFLAILEIDDFKSINIKHGSEYGIKLLKSVKNALKDKKRPQWQIYQIESDKFAFNAVNASKEEVTDFFEAVKHTVFDYCTLSGGAKDYGIIKSETSETVFWQAGMTLDYAKKQGKGIIEFFDARLYEEEEELNSLYENLRKSIANGFEGFTIKYQPQIHAQSFELYSVEALLRYHSQKLGDIMPDKFIPVLEQTRLIKEVGEWVLEESLNQVKKWRKTLPGLRVSVNVSYIQLTEDFAERIIAILDKTGVSGEALTLEIIESAELHEWIISNKMFYKLNKNGVRISIDDFGTGYSNFSYLKKIAVNEVKIDRMFISRIQHSAYNFRLLKNMTELAHSAGIEVCCEGINTIEELQVIKETSSDILQGFLFSVPVDASVIEDCYINSSDERYKKTKKHYEAFKTLEKRSATDVRESINNLVDNMDEIVYVFNNSNYELLYLNSSGRSLTGMYDYAGRKCYEVLMGTNAPCENCRALKSTGDKYSLWKVKNNSIEKSFLIKSKNIEWCGFDATLIIMEES